MGQTMGMSRRQLYRKIKGLTGQTAHEFIRDIRVKRAAQLLEKGKMTVTEVAYETGFKDSISFNRSFHKKFHQSPSNYKKG